MISKNMFYNTEVTLDEYRDMDPVEIIREYLLTKGTWHHFCGSKKPEQVNKLIHPKELVDSGLFVYGLKSNATNRKAVEYYCERWARQNLLLTDKCLIKVPDELWNECDKKNEEFTYGNDRK